eukprot:TRINITY_DN21712_c0_g1_i1.p1 TRINITY_DN21712_c0_g1~~TRINITY_DN21712_c0_g1_i1.p1  ORF type:complete len:261 (+),score=24.78 TRINITY_DN21712_c0_g1_i1:99-785(+)
MRGQGRLASVQARGLGTSQPSSSFSAAFTGDANALRATVSIAGAKAWIAWLALRRFARRSEAFRVSGWLSVVAVFLKLVQRWIRHRIQQDASRTLRPTSSTTTVHRLALQRFCTVTIPPSCKDSDPFERLADGTVHEHLDIITKICDCTDGHVSLCRRKAVVVGGADTLEHGHFAVKAVRRARHPALRCAKGTVKDLDFRSTSSPARRRCSVHVSEMAAAEEPAVFRE